MKELNIKEMEQINGGWSLTDVWQKIKDVFEQVSNKIAQPGVPIQSK